MQIGTVVKLNDRSTSLYKYGIPLSSQICTRYIRGFDLHYEEDIVRAVRGYASNQGGVKFLLVVRVTTSQGISASDLTTDINDTLYERIS